LLRSLFVGEEDFGLDQLAAHSLVFVGEEGGEFQAAQSVNACLETGDALEPPFGTGEGLDHANSSSPMGL
jgi:hypothetical protein